MAYSKKTSASSKKSIPLMHGIRAFIKKDKIFSSAASFFISLKTFFFTHKMSMLVTLVFLASAAILTAVFWPRSQGSSALYAQKPDYQEPAALSRQPLQIVQMTPQGELDATLAKKEIAVVFNHPMKDLAILSLSEMNSGLFTIEPPVQGHFRWYGSKVNAFIPQTSYAPSTNYKITLKKGIKSLNGKELKEDAVFYFSSERFRVHSVSPYQKEISKDSKFTIRFNYDVELSQAQKKISLRLQGGKVLSGNDLKFAYEQEYVNANDEKAEKKNNRKKIIISSRKPLPADTHVTLIVQSSLKPQGGNIGLAEDYKRDYHVYGPLQITWQWQDENINFYRDIYRGGVRFQNKVDLKQAVHNIKISPSAKLSSDWETRESYETNFISFSHWNLKAGVVYTAVLQKDLQDLDGNLVQESQRGESFSFDVPYYQKEFSINNKSSGDFMETDIPARFGVHIQGMEQLQAEVSKISPQVLLGFYDNNRFYRFPKGVGSEQKTRLWNTSLSAASRATLPYDFSWYSKGKSGIYSFRLSGEENFTRYRYGSYFIENETRDEFYFLQVTRMGVVVKSDYQNAHVWVRTLADDTPLANARVQVYDYNPFGDWESWGKRERGQCQTDAQGYCRIPLEYPLHSALFWVSDEKGDNVILKSQDEVDMWSISPFYNEYAYKPQLLGAIIFDRRLYRPGDAVHIKAVLSLKANGRAEPMRQRVLCEVADSRGKIIYQKERIPSEQGGVWFDVTTAQDAPLGHYRVSIKDFQDDEDTNMLLSETFQVEEYRPVTFTVSNEGLHDATVGEKISSQIFARYLFGLPMNAAPFEMHLSRKPLNIHVDQYSNYVFGDDDYGDEWTPAAFDTFANEAGKLDSSGTFAYPFALTELEGKDVPEGLSRHYELSSETIVADVDKRKVSHNENITVYAGKTLPAIYLQDRFHSADKPFEFSFLTLNQEKNPVASRIEVLIEKKEWKSVLSKAGEEDLQRRNTLVRTKVHSGSLSLGKGETSFSFQVKEAGNYTALIRVKGESSYARINFYAYGSQYISWNFPDDDKVSLLADKYSYKAGETARILIQSPFEKATAIVSIERESLHESKVLQIDSNAHPLEIPIKEEYAPNMYVSVVLLRPRVPNANTDEQGDPGRPRVLFGTINLKVDVSSKYIPLSIEPSKKRYHPRDQVRLRIKTQPHAEVALAVSDRAVLDLLAYSFPDVTKRIYDNWAHGVTVFSNHKYLVQQMDFSGKGNAPGGKGLEMMAREAEGGFNKDSEDGIRQDFRPGAYWAPALKADAQGNIDLHFTLPDNLTTFRIMALAAKDGGYATASEEILVQQALVLQASLPRFMRVGDELKIGAVLINQSGQDEEFQVSLQAPLLKNSDNGKTTEFQKNVFLKDTQAKEVTFDVSIDADTFNQILQKNSADKDNSSQAIISGKLWDNIKLEGVLSARSSDGSYKDARKFSFSVEPAPTTESVTISGFSEKGAQEFFTLPKAEEIWQGNASLQVSLASTVLQNIERGFEFYEANPYLCLEQRASLYWMSSIASRLPIFTSAQGKEGEHKKIRSLFVDELTDFQNPDGSFRAWKDSPSYFGSLYLSAYVGLVLQETAVADKKNVSLLQTRSFKKLLAYLQEQIKTYDKKKYSYEDLVLAMYVLQKSGKENRALQKFFLTKQKELSLRSQAYLYLSLLQSQGKEKIKNNVQAQELFQNILNRLDFTSERLVVQEEYYNFPGTYYSRGSAISAILKLFVETRDFQQSSREFSFLLVREMVQKANTFWMTSQESATLANALYGYHEAFEKQMNFDYWMQMRGRNLWKGSFKDFSKAAATKDFSYRQLKEKFKPGRHSVVFDKNSKEGRLYYNMRFSYALPEFRAFPLDRGMTLIREVTNIEEKQNENDVEERILQYYQAKIPTLKRGEMYLFRYTLVVPKPVYSFMLTEYLPSNMEAVQTSFATEAASYGRFVQQKRNESSDDAEFYDQEFLDGEENVFFDNGVRYDFYDERVDIRSDYLAPGIHELYFLARPLVRGKSVYPAAKAFAMYEPDFFATSASGFQVVE